MKRTKPILALLASIIAICLVLTACGPKDEPKAEYSLDKSSVTLVVEGTHQLNVTSSLENEFEVEYDTSAPTIATVSATGLVTAVAPGTANITATVEGTVLTCVVTVEHKYTISKASDTLEVGEYVDLTVKATPTKDLTVAWSSSNADVASVVDGRVTAIAEGTATVSATVDGKTLTCDITVTAAEDQYIYSLNVEAEERLEKDKTLQLELTASPARDDDYEIVWDSDDDEIATVSEDGLVTGVADGTATITATVDGEVVAECEITVFHYEYTFARSLDIDYGDATKALSVTVAPVKDMHITYEVTQGASITVGTDGKITTVGVGASTVTIKDGETVIGTCVVTVKVSVAMAETLELHIGDDHVMEVEIAPDTYTPETLTFEIEDGNNVITLDPTTHTVTAIANGTATVLATVDEKELRCAVTVANVFVTDSDVTNLTETVSKDDPVDITVGAEYWEQYIAAAEINHKQYGSADEDIIDCVKPTTGAYLPDYAAWLAWHGGATSATCNCGKCNKDTQNGGDGGWTDGGTKAYATNVEGEKINIDFTVFAGQSTIKVYTGGFNCKVSAKLKDGETVLDTKNIDNTGVHHSQLVEFTVDVKAKTSLTVELEFVDDNDNYPHSAMSLAAASISGDVYALDKYSVNMTEGDEPQTVAVTKNGEPFTGATFVSSNENVATVNASGVITAVGEGTCTVTVTADGRERHVAVRVFAANADVATASVEDMEGKAYSLMDSNVIDFAYVLYGEISKKYFANGEDYITADADFKTGGGGENNNSSVFIWYEGAVAYNLTSYAANSFSDNAWKKYATGENFKFTVKVPAGEHEVRVYGGAWMTSSLISLKDGEDTVVSQSLAKPAEGSKKLVTFSLKTAEAKTYTLHIDSVDGNNVQLYAIALAEKSEATTTTTVTKSAFTEMDNGDVNLSTVGNLDWVIYNLEHNEDPKSGRVNKRKDGVYLTDLAISSKNEWDYKAKFTWNDGDGQNGDAAAFKDGDQGSIGANNFNNFVASNDALYVPVLLKGNVKTLTLYVTGWKSTYEVEVIDSKGRPLYKETVVAESNDSSIAYAVALNIAATAEDSVILKLNKLSGENIGIAAIAVGGEIA